MPPNDEPGTNRQLVRGAVECEHRLVLWHTTELEQHRPRLHHRAPELRLALAGPHARLGRLLGHRLVREHADGELAGRGRGAHGPAACLELAPRDPARLERLQAELAEADLVAARRIPPDPPSLVFAVLNALWH